jgi:hypothetical protein
MAYLANERKNLSKSSTRAQGYVEVNAPAIEIARRAIAKTCSRAANLEFWNLRFEGVSKHKRK